MNDLTPKQRALMSKLHEEARERMRQALKQIWRIREREQGRPSKHRITNTDPT
jgi:hypothetical protein